MCHTIKGGSTYMNKIHIILENILNQFDSKRSICLLTLSDGEIDDQDKTQKNTENLVKKLNGHFTNFNSQETDLYQVIMLSQILIYYIHYFN